MERIFTKDQLPIITRDVIRTLHLRETAIVVALSGDLGAGKTTFSQELAQQLGVSETVISPTFVIMKRYELPSLGFAWKNLIHIDAYRLNSSNELFKLGWEEMLKDKETLILIEWPEQVPECIPEDAVKISLEHVDPDTRKISY